MSKDTPSEVLRAVRLRGAVFYYIEGAAPWVAEAPAACEIIPAIMAGVDHMIEFHGIVRGSCWGALVGEAPIRLNEGDIIMFPQGDPHVMSSHAGMRATQVDTAFYFTPPPPQLPFSLGLQVGVTVVNTAVGIAAAMLLFRTLRPLRAARAVAAARS